MLQLSGYLGAGVTISGVVVKGGNGYNKYVFGTNAGYLGVNMISSLNGGGKVPADEPRVRLLHERDTLDRIADRHEDGRSGRCPTTTTFTVTVSCPAIGTPLDGFPKTLVFDEHRGR